MPPNFKSAKEAGHVKPSSPQNNNNQQQQQDQNASKRASFIENLFPDKFGKQQQQAPVSNKQQQQNNTNNKRPTSSDPFSRQAQERKGGAPQNQQQKSWCYMPGTTDENGVPRIIPRLGVPVPFPKITGPTRRQRSSSAGKSHKNNNNTNEIRHISWDREVIKKINPIRMIPKEDKPKYWFQEALEETSEAEFVTLSIGSVSIIEPSGPTKLRLCGWEKEETGSTTGRVTLYMCQLPADPRIRPDPSKMVAICTLNPFCNSIPLKIAMPPGPYMIEARYCNKKLAVPRGSKGGDEPKLLLLLETQGQSFALR